MSCGSSKVRSIACRRSWRNRKMKDEESELPKITVQLHNVSVTCSTALLTVCNPTQAMFGQV
jgi:hypothetical protein